MAYFIYSALQISIIFKVFTKFVVMIRIYLPKKIMILNVWFQPDILRV